MHKSTQIRVFFIFIAFLLSNLSFAQSAMGEWILHVPAYKSLDVVVHKNKVYAAFESGVLLYDEDSKEKSILTSVNALSDIAVSKLGYEPETGTVVVGYSNGNIDLVTDNRVDNIPFIKLSTIQGVKTIQRIVSRNGFIYVATGFGIVVIDPKKREVKDTYYPTSNKESIEDIAFSGDTIFALTPSKLMWAKITNPILVDFNQWTEDSRVPFSVVGNYAEMEIIHETIYLSNDNLSHSGDTIFQVKGNGLEALPYPNSGMNLHSLSTDDNHLSFDSDGGMFIYNNSLTGYDYGYYQYPNGSYVNTSAHAKSAKAYYFSDARYGLSKLGTDFSYENLSFEGPARGKFFSMDWKKGALAIAGGGLSGKFATYNISGCYTLKENHWELYAIDNINAWDTAHFYDCIAVGLNPKNMDEMAVSSYTGHPLSIVSADRTKVEFFDPSNSPIELTTENAYSGLISDVTYDSDGNLWLANGFCDKVIKVYTAKKEWFSFDLGGSSKNQFTGKLVKDYNDVVWVSVYGQGIYALDYGGTIDNPADDKIARIKKSDLTENLPSNNVRAIAVDLDNKIWLGTDEGFAIIYSSGNAFSSTSPDYIPQRIKLEYENNVEYLLGSTAINDIEVDGGNRKWLATDGAGVFLLSPDGATILANYTMENSDLISNSVMDLEIDDNTGEVYMITEIGLISLRTDASFEDPEYSNVVVFPNPATPDFEGPITIQGIRYNSDVKITDMGGNLVYKTTSNGGTAIWNGKTLTGEKVATGVYLIWTAANEGKGRKVGKVTIINE